MKNICLFLTAALFSTFIKGQELNIPESVLFDPSSERYLVSNFGDGNIIEVAKDGSKSFFKQGLEKPLASVIYKDVFYVINGIQSLSGFRLSDARKVFEIKIPEAKFLNDMASDDKGSLYLTDSFGGAIFEINISDNSYSLLLDTEMDSSNGIIYDKANHRLVFCYFEESSAIDQFDLVSNQYSRLLKTDLHNLDGLALDEQGNIYVSSWGAGSFKNGFEETGKVLKFDGQFSQPPVVVTDSYEAPANINYNPHNKELVVPLFFKKDIKFISLK